MYRPARERRVRVATCGQVWTPPIATDMVPRMLFSLHTKQRSFQMKDRRDGLRDRNGKLTPAWRRATRRMLREWDEAAMQEAPTPEASPPEDWAQAIDQMLDEFNREAANA